MEPRYARAKIYTAIAYYQTGRHSDAIATLRQAAEGQSGDRQCATSEHDDRDSQERAEENPRRHSGRVHHDELGIIAESVEYVRDRDHQRHPASAMIRILERSPMPNHSMKTGSITIFGTG